MSTASQLWKPLKSFDCYTEFSNAINFDKSIPENSEIYVQFCTYLYSTYNQEFRNSGK